MSESPPQPFLSDTHCMTFARPTAKHLCLVYILHLNSLLYRHLPLSHFLCPLLIQPPQARNIGILEATVPLTLPRCSRPASASTRHSTLCTTLRQRRKSSSHSSSRPSPARRNSSTLPFAASLRGRVLLRSRRRARRAQPPRLRPCLPRLTCLPRVERGRGRTSPSRARCRRCWASCLPPPVTVNSSISCTTPTSRANANPSKWDINCAYENLIMRLSFIICL